MLNITVHLENHRIPTWLGESKLVHPVLRVNYFSNPFQGTLDQVVVICGPVDGHWQSRQQLMIHRRLCVSRKLLQKSLVQPGPVHAVVIYVVLRKRNQMIAFTRSIQAEFGCQWLEKPNPIDKPLSNRQASAGKDRRRLIVKFLDVFPNEGIQFIDKHGVSSVIS
ncbi:MAG TPA: hypothetical protein PLL01_00405 [Rhodoferax sp.]|nr:hypothetical protein [Rhodoferax sp.]